MCRRRQVGTRTECAFTLQPRGTLGERCRHTTGPLRRVGVRYGYYCPRAAAEHAVAVNGGDSTGPYVARPGPHRVWPRTAKLEFGPRHEARLLDPTSRHRSSSPRGVSSSARRRKRAVPASAERLPRHVVQKMRLSSPRTARREGNRASFQVGGVIAPFSAQL